MIEYIRGSIADLSPTLAVLDANGVGYGLNITLNTFSAIQGLPGDVKLFVYESIREDAYVLWGFATKVERELFVLLTSVSGVGALKYAGKPKVKKLDESGVGKISEL